MATYTMEELVLRLFEVSGLKFGNFTVRTGETSPVYIDMRVIWSYPDIVVSAVFLVGSISILVLVEVLATVHRSVCSWGSFL